MNRSSLLIFSLSLLLIFSVDSISAQKGYKKKKKDPASTVSFGSASTSITKSGKREVYWENGNKKRTETLDGKLFRQGVYKEWYENGKLKVSETYERGRRVGLCQTFYPSGNLHTSYNYILITQGNGDGIIIGTEEAGVLQGKGEEFHDNGNKKKEYTYFQGEVRGPYKEWHENGQLAKEGQVIKEFNSGEYAEYHENGTTKLKGEYDRNQRVGKWVATHDNGQTHYVELYEKNNTFLEGTKGRRIDGPWKSYHPNGEIEKIGQYLNGRQDSIWRGFHDNAQEMYVVKYKNGKRMGLYKEYYANGVKKVEGEYGETVADINRSRKEGVWTEWHENGQPMRTVNYKNGRREGLSTEWYANGQKRFETEFVFGGRKESMYDGMTTEYHENGQLKYKGLYDKGRRDGEWKEFNDDGTLNYEAYYDKAKLAGRVTKYYKNGNKMSEGEYKMSRVQKKTGEWKEWHENGERKFIGSFVNGDRKGVIFEYYDNGQLKREALFEDNMIVGFVKEYYPDGSKKIDGSYCSDYSRRGLKCGKWQVWDKEGNMVKDEMYKNGRLQ